MDYFLSLFLFSFFCDDFETFNKIKNWTDIQIKSIAWTWTIFYAFITINPELILKKLIALNAASVMRMNEILLGLIWML